MIKTRKKLIEVALPLEAINVASAREKSIRYGHPSTLHLWWARRPLAAARAVIFAQMVDDPSSWPDLFPTEKKQDKERKRLFKIVEDLVLWESTTNDKILQAARDEIWSSWRRTCADNVDHAKSKELFDRTVLPAFHDPFAGGGALPLEAQRLGLESHASDLNPVAVMINKAMIQIPPKFSGNPPVNPEWRNKSSSEKALSVWSNALGLAEDIRYYGQWIRFEAEKRIGHLYPEVEVTSDLAKDRADLTPYVGKRLKVITWIWARTVKSPDPAFNKVDVPLASTFMLSTKAGKEAYVEPVVEGGKYRFTVKVGKPMNLDLAKSGTKLARGANFRCLMSDAPITGDYIKAEGKAERLGTRLMAIVAEGDRGRIYLPPILEHEIAAQNTQPAWWPEVMLSGSTQYLGVKPYGIDRVDQLFTDRQLVSLTTFSDLVAEVRARIQLDAVNAGLPEDNRSLDEDGSGIRAYAEAISVALAFGVSKLADRGSTICAWDCTRDSTGHTFGRQAIPMVWDFGENNPFSNSSGCWENHLHWIVTWYQSCVPVAKGIAIQSDAQTQSLSIGAVVSTDPPYYDNVPYADLSDFFYVWLRRAMRDLFPNLFATLAVPKTEELVAFAYRHDTGKSGAEVFFLNGMTLAMRRIVGQSHPAFPVTIYYAFKQSESDDDKGTTNTGWDTFLAAVIDAGFVISGTWPMRTELANRMRGSNSNALASSIVLVCRPRPVDAPTVTRRNFLNALKSELPAALAHLQAGNIAPVDLAQAAIGPGMAVYTRYAKVLDAEGNPLTVRAALSLINQVLDESLAEQEGDFDAETRWALAWFEQLGFEEGEFGVAEQLSKAKNTAVTGLVESGIIRSGRGKVQLLRPAELLDEWDPQTDQRLTTWESVHRLIQAQEAFGEPGAAAIVAKLGGKAETARELCYRLYTLCERKRRANDAMPYNALVQSWPEIVRLAQQNPNNTQEQARDLFSQE